METRVEEDVGEKAEKPKSKSKSRRKKSEDMKKLKRSEPVPVEDDPLPKVQRMLRTKAERSQPQNLERKKMSDSIDKK